MKDENKPKPGPKELPGTFTFEEAMRKIVNTSKVEVERAIAEKKKPRRKIVRHA